jgi:hypothetical protein
VSSVTTEKESKRRRTLEYSRPRFWMILNKFSNLSVYYLLGDGRLLMPTL